MVDRLVVINSTTDEALAEFFRQAGRALLPKAREDVVSSDRVTRIINVDSFFRESLLEPADNFTCTLSETLYNVTSISLLTVEIPQTWYTFTAAKGTVAFVFQCLQPDDSVYTEEISIKEGNYSNLSLLATVQTALNSAVRKTSHYGKSVFGEGPWITLVQDPIDGLVRAKLDAAFPQSIKLSWYDPAFPILATTKISGNLGWHLGFRFIYSILQPAVELVGTSVVKAASSPKYLVLKIDDHVPTRLASNFITIRTNSDQQVRLPTYSNLALLTNRGSNEVFAIPSAPRRLTSKQLFTISSISSNVQTPSGRIDGADTTNFFAKIPIKHQTDWANYANGVNTLREDGPGRILVEMGGTLQKNRRTYFGPVTLRKLSISLCDDRGHLVGINENWSFTLEATFV
jgi:hypothetical protein